uniref:Uncharacterized protein n=1 Tax=Vespula pensylvanica TaxID=30213 RepID=A0A834NX41_VESPE|nr:hypothetical protein H0235_010432 [Vespula pensylvanica]
MANGFLGFSCVVVDCSSRLGNWEETGRNDEDEKEKKKEKKEKEREEEEEEAEEKGELRNGRRTVRSSDPPARSELYVGNIVTSSSLSSSTMFFLPTLASRFNAFVLFELVSNDVSELDQLG